MRDENGFLSGDRPHGGMDILTWALLAILPVIAVLAGVRDLTTMTIPNWMSLVLLAAFIPAARH